MKMCSLGENLGYPECNILELVKSNNEEVFVSAGSLNGKVVFYEIGYFKYGIIIFDYRSNISLHSIKRISFFNNNRNKVYKSWSIKGEELASTNENI